MSRKELPRAGPVQGALAGRISNREGATTAPQLTIRQFQRLKQRFRLAAAAGLCHQGHGRPSPRRLAAAVCAQVEAASGAPSGWPRSIAAGRPSTAPGARANRPVANCCSSTPAPRLAGGPRPHHDSARGDRRRHLGGRRAEDLHGYATLFQQVFATAGRPVALTVDGVTP